MKPGGCTNAAKVVRGQLLVFTSTPRDADGSIPRRPACGSISTICMPIGTTSTDPAIDMDPQMDGTYRGQFDTKDAEPGAAFASIRAEAPPAADDIKFTIIANAANPDP